MRFAKNGSCNEGSFSVLLAYLDDVPPQPERGSRLGEEHPAVPAQVLRVAGHHPRWHIVGKLDIDEHFADCGVLHAQPRMLGMRMPGDALSMRVVTVTV